MPTMAIKSLQLQWLELTGSTIFDPNASQRLYKCYCDLSTGNAITSLIDCESVRSIASLSIPKPIPPVGGIPYSRAVTKSSSRVFSTSCVLSVKKSAAYELKGFLFPYKHHISFAILTANYYLIVKSGRQYIVQKMATVL